MGKPFKGSLKGLGTECIPGVSENQGKANTSGKSQYTKGSGATSYDPLGASADSRPEQGDNRPGAVPGTEKVSMPKESNKRSTS